MSMRAAPAMTTAAIKLSFDMSIPPRGRELPDGSRSSQSCATEGYAGRTARCNPTSCEMLPCERALVDRSLGLDVARPDHLAPLLGFVGDELAEIAGRAGNRRAAEISEPSFEFGIGQRSIDLPVQRIDEPCGRGLRRTQADPVACF